MQFLMGLNETYGAIRGQILLMNPLPTVRQAYAAVTQEEKQRLISVSHPSTDSSSSEAMAGRNSKPNQDPARGRRFGRSDHPNLQQDFRPNFRSDRAQEGRRFDGDRRRGSGRGRPQCSYCGDAGHWVQTCYQLIGYPPGHPKAKQNSGSNSRGVPFANQVSEALDKDEGGPVVSFSEAQFKHFLSMINKQNEGSSSKANAVTKPGLSKVASRNWIIDSGATDHITSSSQFLHKNKHCWLPPILLPSGDKVNIIAKGSLPLYTIYYLHDVLFVPKLKVDLMSVSRLTRGLNCSVTFFPYWCILQDLTTKRTIGLGKQRDGLYYSVALATKKSVTNPSTNRPACNLTISTDLWLILGHVSPSCLSFIAKHFLNFSIQHNNACHICPLAKQSRLPFNTSSISSTRPFEMIHCDIWGRYRHPSLSGAFYFLTIVDDFTRFTWIFLMRHKDEAQPLLKCFFHYTLIQFESRIKTFRSDNGGEFISLRSFFQDNGVVFQHSCVYTPQQNGVMERKHRHILQVDRALKFQAHLPTQFWGECVLTAVHIINRLPSPILSFQTPFELLYSKPPSFSHLRVFGCLTYATNVHTSHKFDHRAIPSIFIGYPIGQKAFKLFNLSTKKIFTSRDVKFHETIFPYASIQPSSIPSSLAHKSGPIPLLTHPTSSLLDSSFDDYRPPVCSPSSHNPEPDLTFSSPTSSRRPTTPEQPPSSSILPDLSAPS